jgi:hypothetical protein
MVWRVGRIQVDSANKLQLILDQKPKLLAQLDKHKVEALAIRETQTDEPELVVGVDNENLGGKIRRLQLSARRDPAS